MPDAEQSESWAFRHRTVRCKQDPTVKISNFSGPSPGSAMPPRGAEAQLLSCSGKSFRGLVPQQVSSGL